MLVPTIVRRNGLALKVLGPPREHPPPHVHVYKGHESVVVIRLGIAGGPPRVWTVHGMRNADVIRAYRLVEEHEDVLRAAWERIHGESQ